MKKMSSSSSKGMNCGGGVKAMAKGGMVKSSSSCGSKGYMKGGAVRGQGASTKVKSCKVY